MRNIVQKYHLYSIAGCRSLSFGFIWFVDFYTIAILEICFTFGMDVTYVVRVFLISSLLQMELECVSCTKNYSFICIKQLYMYQTVVSRLCSKTWIQNEQKEHITGNIAHESFKFYYDKQKRKINVQQVLDLNYMMGSRDNKNEEKPYITEAFK